MDEFALIMSFFLCVLIGHDFMIMFCGFFFFLPENPCLGLSRGSTCRSDSSFLLTVLLRISSYASSTVHCLDLELKVRCSFSSHYIQWFLRGTLSSNCISFILQLRFCHKGSQARTGKTVYFLDYLSV